MVIFLRGLTHIRLTFFLLTNYHKEEYEELQQEEQAAQAAKKTKIVFRPQTDLLTQSLSHTIGYGSM